MAHTNDCHVNFQHVNFTSHLAPSHSIAIVFLMSMLASAFSPPCGGIKVSPPLMPEFSDIFRPRCNPLKGFARATHLLTWYTHTLTYNTNVYFTLE